MVGANRSTGIKAWQGVFDLLDSVPQIGGSGEEEDFIDEE